MKIFFTAILLLFATTSFAQTITKIKYDGLIHISKPVALRMLPFHVGDDIDEKMVDDAIKIYFDQNYFNDIWAEIENDELTFYFKEKPAISKIVLKGYKEDDKEFKESTVRIKRGSLYNPKKLEAAKKRIIDAIAKDGMIDSVVEIELDYLENGSVKVTFLINEGEEIVINKLTYSGVKGLDAKEFDEVIANKEHQWMGWLWGRNDGKMNLLDLEYDNHRIREYYMQHGFLDAQVDAPFVKVDFNHYLAQMSYKIEEGKQYKVNSVSINQITNVIEDTKLYEQLKLKKGDIFNIQTFRQDATRIKTQIADLSYAFVQVVPDLKKNQKDGSVDVIFRIMPGEKVKIRDVIISGNNRTLDRIIRRELYLGPNDMYSLTDLKDSKHALGRLGFFEKNSIEERRINANTMDLIVKVKETPTGNIQVGGGYGSYGGIMINLAVSDRDIFGSGIDVGVKAEKSQMTKNYSFNISNKHLNDSDFSGDFSIYSSNYNYTDYTVDTTGFSVGVGHRITRNLSGYLSYSYSKNKYDYSDDMDFNKTDTFYFETYSKSSVSVSLKYDNTDDYYVPREGIMIKEILENAGLGGDAKLAKSRTILGKYNGLKEYIGLDVIFRYKARLNLLKDYGYVPIGEKFYLGGIGSVRGYQAYSLAPTIKDSKGIERRIGGRKSFSNSLELSFPLLPKAKMRLVTYIDWGFIGDSSIKEISRGGYGGGIEWISPVGPIQIMFSKPLNQQEGDKISGFDFAMGQRF